MVLKGNVAGGKTVTVGPPRSGFLGFSGLSQWTERWAS